MFDESPSLSTCPRCQSAFPPKRTNQHFCGRACQNAATRNTSRGSQKVADSPSTRRLGELHRGRAFLLNDELYRTPPADRPALIEAILKAAREHDWHLRRILIDRTSLYNFGGDHAGRPNLVRTVDDCCKLTRGGARVYQVVANDWQEPEEIRPLALYNDPYTPTKVSQEVNREAYQQVDTAAFFADLNRLRQEVPLTVPPKHETDEGLMRRTIATVLGDDHPITLAF